MLLVHVVHDAAFASDTAWTLGIHVGPGKDNLTWRLPSRESGAVLVLVLVHRFGASLLSAGPQTRDPKPVPTPPVGDLNTRALWRMGSSGLVGFGFGSWGLRLQHGARSEVPTGYDEEPWPLRNDKSRVQDTLGGGIRRGKRLPCADIRRPEPENPKFRIIRERMQLYSLLRQLYFFCHDGQPVVLIEVRDEVVRGRSRSRAPEVGAAAHAPAAAAAVAVAVAVAVVVVVLAAVAAYLSALLPKRPSTTAARMREFVRDIF